MPPCWAVDISPARMPVSKRFNDPGRADHLGPAAPGRHQPSPTTARVGGSRCESRLRARRPALRGTRRAARGPDPVSRPGHRGPARRGLAGRHDRCTTPDGNITISVTMADTGSRPGTESVQLDLATRPAHRPPMHLDHGHRRPVDPPTRRPPVAPGAHRRTPARSPHLHGLTAVHRTSSPPRGKPPRPDHTPQGRTWRSSTIP